MALHHNQIKCVEGLKHLKKLAFLDLSHNLIEEIPDVSELPGENMMILKLSGNPVKDYRKRVVLHMPRLEELDRVKVIEAERLAYRGLIKIDVDKMLEQYRVERQDHDAKERMERDLYLDFMQDKGMLSSDRMIKSLDEFSNMEEFDKLHKQFAGMMSDHKAHRELQENQALITKAEVSRQVSEVMQRYNHN